MTRSWPRISIVTPSFEQGRFLGETIESVLREAYPAVEHIVIDGGSRDGTAEVLAHYGDRLAAWVSEPDRGQAHAINKGLARATGDVIGWLNSDDLLLPGSLRRIGRAFRDPKTAVVSGLRRVIDEAGRPLSNWVRDLPTRHYLRHYCCVPQETVYWRREITEEIGTLDEDLDYALDWEYWLRMLEAGHRFTFLPAYLGAFRRHAASKSQTLEEVYHREVALLYRRYDLGRNEESVLRGLGATWPAHLALLEDLSRSRWSASPRLVGLLLRLFEHRSLDRRIARLYWRYRARRPRGRGRPGRLPVAVAAVGAELRDAPLPDRQDPWLLRANPLHRVRMTAAEASRECLCHLPADTLRIGAGWSWIEHSSDQVYRWAAGSAEVVVLRPSGRRRRLRLLLDAGPSLGWSAFPLEVRDEEGTEVARLEVGARDQIEIELPLTAGRESRCFRLVVPSRGTPASDQDPRVLDFRATWLGWAEDDELWDLPLEKGVAPLEVALVPDDVVPGDGVRALSRGRRSRAVPPDLLLVGRGWLAREVDEEGPSRVAVDRAEIVVAAPSGRHQRLVVELDRAEPATALRLVARGAPQGIESPVEASRANLSLPIEPGASSVWQLRAIAEGRELDSFRVRRIAWTDVQSD